jgi:hypothetical protein
VLLDEEHAGTGRACREGLSEVPRHRSEVVRDKDATLRGSQSEHIAIAHSLQLCRTRGSEVDLRLATEAARDDRVMKTGVRQEADHALPRMQLAPSVLYLLFQISGRSMRFGESILFAFTRREILVHLHLVAQVESDGAVHLLQRQRGKR